MATLRALLAHSIVTCSILAHDKGERAPKSESAQVLKGKFRLFQLLCLCQTGRNWKLRMRNSLKLSKDKLSGYLLDQKAF